MIPHTSLTTTTVFAAASMLTANGNRSNLMQYECIHRRPTIGAATTVCFDTSQQADIGYHVYARTVGAEFNLTRDGTATLDSPIHLSHSDFTLAFS